MNSRNYDPRAVDTSVDLPERRRPVTDVAEWLRGLDPGVGQALHALGELLIGVGDHAETTETAEEFALRCLCVIDGGQLLDEQSALNAVSRLTTALVLAQWIEDHGSSCEIGSGEHTQPPSWTQTKVGGRIYRHPQCLQVHFPAGTIAAIGCVIGIETRDSVLRAPEVSVCTLQRDQAAAREILDRLTARAADFNPFRGRAIRATAVKGLNFTVIDLPALATRDHVIVPETVWTEIDLAIAAVRDRHELLNASGLGARRGVLLCGPPGTGKSAVSAVVAKEVVGEFTVIYVEAKAGVQLLTAVVEEAQQLGGPVLLILEDVDLWCRDRASGPGAGLSELLGAMDIRPESRILTLASTNDAATLDKAAIRTGRFDSVIEIGYPDRSASARILTALLRVLPGGGAVDSGTVAAALPQHTSGSDIRELVRRAVLTGVERHVSTEALLAEVGRSRYRAETPTGTYL
ncbi:ATP-binding protein [Mycobacterium intracellulare]|uniref:AAA family ATPase n=1 Tax=Mycobacterium intracellulare TaxID=1767 RepID=UPI001CDA336C|nr:ATP-binding protein [Mycobacterium intracellulare]MCA2247593.1 ATP-binding protein [Mycobacterium intracellulare]